MYGLCVLWTYIYACVPIYTHICIITCIYICMHAYTCTHVCLPMYIRRHTSVWSKWGVTWHAGVNACIHIAYIHTSESHDADTGANCITLPKSHVTPHFDYLDLRNAILPLKMSLASQDTDASENCVTWPKKSCCTPFWLSWNKECNGAINNTVGFIWCHCWCQWHYMIKYIHISSCIYVCNMCICTYIYSLPTYINTCFHICTHAYTDLCMFAYIRA